MSNNDMVSSIGSCWLRKAAKQYNSCRLYIRMAVMSRPCVAERERERDSWSTQILLLSVAPRVFYCYSCTWLVKNPCTLVILSSTTRWPFWTCAFLQLCSTGARAPCLIQITRLSFVGSKKIFLRWATTRVRCHHCDICARTSTYCFIHAQRSFTTRPM